MYYCRIIASNKYYSVQKYKIQISNMTFMVFPCFLKFIFFLRHYFY